MMPSVLHVAVAVCVGAAGVAVLVWRWKVQDRRRKARRHCNDPNYETFPLMLLESSLMRAFAVSTITFFKGDSDMAEDWIKTRTLEIMRANPWLAGRLVSSDEDSRPHLCHPKCITQQDLQDYVTILDNPSLSHTMSYNDMVGDFSHLLIKRGMECIDLDEHLFKILIIRTSPESFALIVSFSHLLGDGNTYYKLYSMFSCNRSVTTLVAPRRHDFVECSKGLFRVREIVNYKLFLFRAVLFTLLPKPRSLRAFLTEIDPKWVAAEKKRYCPPHDSSHSFVSTNDILVSWFMRTAEIDFCMMAFNARERIPAVKDIDSNFAGNYLTPIIYLNKDAQSPHQIRKSLTFVSAEDAPRGEAGFRTEYDHLPSSLEMLRFNAGLTTNWSTFYSDIEFPVACIVEHHSPVVQLSVARYPNVLLIYRQNKDKLGILITSPCPAIHASIQSGGGPFLVEKSTELDLKF